MFHSGSERTMLNISNREKMYVAGYGKLLEFFPQRPWSEAFSKLGSSPEIHKLGENYISYGLYLWENKAFEELDIFERDAVAEAIYYNEKIRDFYEQLQNDKKAAFKARWSAAFRAVNDMRALIFEVFVYFSLKFYDWNVACKDDELSGEYYDYLATRGNDIIQMECKSFAYDKGLCITADEANKVTKMVLPDWRGLNQNPKNELCITTVNIYEKLPSNPAALKKICTEICELINLETDFHGEKFSVNLQRHLNVSDIQGDICSILPVESDEIELSCTVTLPDGDNSRACLRITTIASNSFWREFEKVCKDAAKKQLKKERPATLLIHASNIDSARQMLKDRRFAEKMENIFNQRHLIGMVLMSNHSVNEQDEFPYLYVAPFIKEFPNANSVFDYPGKIFAREVIRSSE